MRERERLIHSDGPIGTTLVTDCLTPTTNYQQVQYAISNDTAYGVTSTENTVDVVTPDFKERSAQGEIINNPFRREIVTTIGPKAMQVDVYKESNYWPVVHGAPCNTWWHMHGTRRFNNGPPIFLRTDIAEVASCRQSVIDLAVTSAHAKVDTSEMMALATLAESGKTVESLYSILRKVFRIWKAVRRLDVKAASEEFSPKELANAYMQARYALRPLLYDVNDLMSALEKKRGSSRQTFRGWEQDSISGQDTTYGCVVQDHLSCDVLREWSYHVSARAGVLCNVTVDGAGVFGLTQIPETLWELVPFSFIVDWFCNVGDTIAAYTPDYGVEQLASWVTVKETWRSSSTPVNMHSTWVPSQYDVSVTQTGSGGDMTYEELVLERIIDPELSIFPRYSLSLDKYKILDLVLVMRGR